MREFQIIFLYDCVQLEKQSKAKHKFKIWRF
jgi:hypothetical protein